MRSHVAVPYRTAPTEPSRTSRLTASTILGCLHAELSPRAGGVPIVRPLSFAVASLLLATSAHAGKFTVQNCGKKVRVCVYDYGDYDQWIQADSKVLAFGETRQFKCDTSNHCDVLVNPANSDLDCWARTELVRGSVDTHELYVLGTLEIETDSPSRAPGYDSYSIWDLDDDQDADYTCSGAMNEAAEIKADGYVGFYYTWEVSPKDEFFTVKTTTDTDTDSDSNDDIRARLMFEDGSTGPWQVLETPNNDFEKGNTDTFEMLVDHDLGSTDLAGILIENPGTDAWRPSKITIDLDDTRLLTYDDDDLKLDDACGGDTSDGCADIALIDTDGNFQHHYDLELTTSSLTSADSDDPMHVQVLLADGRHSSWMRLKNRGEKTTTDLGIVTIVESGKRFEKGATVKVDLYDPMLFEGHSDIVGMRIQNKGEDKWIPSRVVLEPAYSGGTAVSYSGTGQSLDAACDNDPGDGCSPTLTLDAAGDVQREYTLVTTTGDGTYDGTDSAISAALLFSGHVVTPAVRLNTVDNDFEKDAEQAYAVYMDEDLVDGHDLIGLRLSNAGTDQWRPVSLELRTADGDLELEYDGDSSALDQDCDEGMADGCSPELTVDPDGVVQREFTVTAETANLTHSGSDSAIEVRFEGSNGDLTGWSRLNLAGDDFEKEDVDTYAALLHDHSTLGDNQVSALHVRTLGSDGWEPEALIVDSSAFTSSEMFVSRTVWDTTLRFDTDCDADVTDDCAPEMILGDDGTVYAP